MTLFCSNIIHFISLTPTKTRFQPYFAVLFAFYRRVSKVSANCCTFAWLWIAKGVFNQVSPSSEAMQYILSSILCPSIFRQICRHYNATRLLHPINVNSSSSYALRLQYPRLHHCRIVLIEEMKTLVALERKNLP